jgi:DNA-directed RNA polymerase subunit RPC12/RpoP
MALIIFKRRTDIMKLWSTLLLFFTVTSHTYASLENTTCKKCHPVIFQEYQNSMHAKASIFKDPVHKAVWDKHPAKKKNNYKCAKCHTPSDHDLISGKSKLVDNAVQQNEPISCQQCHRIQSIEKHAKANKNIMSKKEKYFFSANKVKKGQKIVFKEEKFLFGLMTKASGSPYHDIDYGNENFYTGEMCMGCHAHKQNGKGFAVCDLEVKKKDSKETCISCHMPKVKGSLANQKESDTHAFHGISIHNGIPKTLSRYVKLSLKEAANGFTVTVKNEATHTLFPQPLRLNQLRVEIERAGKTITLDPQNFVRVIGTNGKPSMPWLATEVLKDTTIKALETRKIDFNRKLQKGDVVTVRFGYYISNPKAAEKLGIKQKSVRKFTVLSKKIFKI